ncbi:MAG: HEAT repeat domain-containing protein [Bradymonadia bacterium]
MIRRALLPAVGWAVIALSAAHAQDPEGGLPSLEELEAQATTLYSDLEGTTDPLVRQAIFRGKLLLGGDAQKGAIEGGLEDGDAEIKGRSVVLALESKDKKVRGKGQAALDKLLASGDEAEREMGHGLVAKLPAKQQLALIKKAAKEGVPDARAQARKALLKMGGKTAWQVIELGLAEPADEPEHKEALEALKSFSHPSAFKWATNNLHDMGAMGDLARDYLVRLDDKKSVKKLTKLLKKTFDKEPFDKRLNAASVMSRRGIGSDVHKPLVACLARMKKAEHAAKRRVAWAGMDKVFRMDALKALKGQLLTNEKEADADAGYAWLKAWAKARSEPEVIKLLQKVAKSDRDELRMRALQVLTELKHRPSVVIFEESMREGRTEVRLAAAKGWAAVSKPGDIKRISQVLRKEPDIQVKEALVQALANIGTGEIVSPLQFVVMSPQKSLKTAAVKALGATGRTEAVTAIRLVKRDPDLDVRFLALQQLLKLDPKTTLKSLNSAVRWMQPSHIETLAKDEKVDIAVFEAIALKGSDEQRVYAVDGLVSRGNAGATRLLGLVNGAHADTATAAFKALADMRKGESMATYRKQLESKHLPVRAEAYGALANYGSEASLELVIPGMTDKEPLIRARAAEAALTLANRINGGKKKKRRRRRR